MVSGAALGLFFAPPSSGAERVVGSYYYQCSTQVKFMVLGPTNQPPVFKYPLKPRRPVQPWLPGPAGPEQIDASATVEADGSITNLRMDWLQAGLLGWPQYGRADLDDILLHVRYDNAEAPHSQFDPALLTLEISALETKKMKRPRLLTIQRSLGDSEKLGGLADIPAWLRSASIVVPWPELQRLARAQSKLYFSVDEIVFRDKQFYHDHIRGGELDLSVMAEVIKWFKQAESQIKSEAELPSKLCQKTIVEPQIDDSALSEF
jgi:hypothetical protein